MKMFFYSDNLYNRVGCMLWNFYIVQPAVYDLQLNSLQHWGISDLMTVLRTGSSGTQKCLWGHT